MEENEQETHVDETLAPAAPTPAQESLPADRNVWKTVGIIMAVLVVVVIASAIFYGLATHPYFTAILRDVSIIVLALVTMITSIFLAILLFQLQSLIVLLRDEIQPILESMNETAGTVRGTTTFVSDAVVTPLIQVASYASAVSTTIKTLFGGPRRSTRSHAEKPSQGQDPQETSAVGSVEES